VSHGVSLGALAGLDLDPLVHLPVTLQAGYRGDLPIGSGRTVDHAALGVYYSGRVNLALGLEMAYRHGLIRPGVDPTLNTNSVSGLLWFRYYW
jgi:hypothetical protein